MREHEMNEVEEPEPPICDLCQSYVLRSGCCCHYDERLDGDDRTPEGEEF